MESTLKYHYENPKFSGKTWLIEESRKPKRKKQKLYRNQKKQRRQLRAKLQAQLQDRAQKTRAYLKDFWEIFNTGKVDRLKLVCMVAKPSWPRVDPALRLRLRKEFARRYTQYLVGISEECAICSARRWSEKHHIIPLSHGGINDNLNLMGICQPCHDEIHPWMKHA